MFSRVSRLFTAPRSPSTIQADETVLLFPTAGRYEPSEGVWHVPLHGWIFEPEASSFSRRAAIGALRMSLRLDRDAEETELFRRRARWFLVDNERGKRIAVAAAGQAQILAPSGANGHFHGHLILAQTDAPVASSIRGGAWLPLETTNPVADDRTFQGVAQLVPPHGVSIISDVDDTIKVSEVGSKRSLLRNTFLRDFEAVAGMAAQYARWSAAGAVFHYVTTTPWQLFEPLEQFRALAGFPAGTWHMKLFRTRDKTLLNLWANPEKFKRRAIEPLLLAFPERSFILVGDSGQRDPQLYGDLARRFPQQVTHIFIRDVTGEATQSVRYREAFQGVPANKWRVFRDAAELDHAPLEWA